MKKIPNDYLLPSAAFTILKNQLKYYKKSKNKPKVGDLVYGLVSSIGEHDTLENKSGRIHKIHNGTKAIFVFGNRYAPDYYEGVIPEKFQEEVDLLARSGLIGIVKNKNSIVADPTRVKVLGYVYNKEGKKVNTKDYPIIKPKHTNKKEPRSKMILICGTSMNSGKSMAAAACCWALKNLGYKVRASKITGTASLKDILHMNDAGARPFADFSYLGYPSTYLLSKKEILKIFNILDLKYANNPKNFWVIELADGINQRETSWLLNSTEVKGRIHKLVFCAADAFGAIGGLKILKEKFDLKPDAISGICSSSPLHVKEIKEFTDIEIFNNSDINVSQLKNILID